jgi:hypothetical protein
MSVNEKGKKTNYTPLSTNIKSPAPVDTTPVVINGKQISSIDDTSPRLSIRGSIPTPKKFTTPPSVTATDMASSNGRSQMLANAAEKRINGSPPATLITNDSTIIPNQITIQMPTPKFTKPVFKKSSTSTSKISVETRKMKHSAGGYSEEIEEPQPLPLAHSVGSSDGIRLPVPKSVPNEMFMSIPASGNIKSLRVMAESPPVHNSKYELPEDKYLTSTSPGTPHYVVQPEHKREHLPIPKVNIVPVKSSYTEPRYYQPQQQYYNPQSPRGYNQYARPQQQLSYIQPPVQPTRPNYAKMTEEKSTEIRNMFRAKFMTLRTSFPESQIPEFDKSMSLDQIHDVYEVCVKQVMVSLNTGQWKVYLILFFLAIEIGGIKLLGLDFSGYTMSQASALHKYDRLLVELGEKYYAEGSSNWPIEARFFMMAGLNAIIFCIVKYVGKYVGDDMAKEIQKMIETATSGAGNIFTDNGVQRDENGVPLISEEASKKETGGGLGDIVSNLMGGGNGDMSSAIANIGTMFTKNMKKTEPVVAKPTAKDVNPESQRKRHVVFGE